MGIKGKSLVDSQSFHQSKISTVDETEGLIRKGLDNPPGGFQVYRIYG